ncbi:MAG TPA: MlaD family protein, partial [Candidatus Cloacimonadota bacterium]|nr:MlaD family protein [Candidatus Cloacimonadota bacterium]
MVSKATKVRLGIFLAIGFIAILLFAIAVAGNRLTQKWDTYYIMFKDYPVSGLQVGGTVNYQGIKVGQVQAVKIDPEDVSKVIITINVEPGTPIKEDTEAVLSLVGITGLKAVEIKGGTNEAKNMQPESFIKAGSTMLDDISDRALSIAEKIDVIAANIGEITNNENQESIARILSETSLLLADTRANLGGTLASLNRIAENTAGVTEDFGKNLERLTT